MKLSNLLKHTFYKYPLDHSLNINNFEKFIDACDPKVREICIILLQNTIHISFETFLISLNSNINDLLSKVNSKRPIFILVDTLFSDDFKLKSNYWIYIYVQNYIKFKTSSRRKIILITNLEYEKLKNNDFIIFLDDCVYSGLQMTDTISELKNNNKLYFNLFFLIPFISYEGFTRINTQINSMPNLKNYCNLFLNENYFEILPINNLLTPKQIKLIDNFYGGLLNFNYSYLIYFDHKLADTASTLTLFYLGLIPNNKNKKLFNKLKIILNNILRNKQYNIYIETYHNFINNNDFDIIPIIKNCENYTKNLDILSSKCPYPPYKKGFFNFIKEIKKTKNIKSLSYKKYKSVLLNKNKSI